MDLTLGLPLRSDTPLAELLPAYVCIEESVDDIVAALLPGEEEPIRNAAPARRTEYVTGRALARRALASFGAPTQSILKGSHGEPCWPAGFVGSITHCSGYRAAAVARSDRLRGLGVDVERRTVLSASMTEIITTPQERQRALDARWPPEWSLHVFCAKEAAFKAIPTSWSPPLDLTELDVKLYPRTYTFTAAVEDLLLHGRWGTQGEHVFAGAVVWH